MITGFRVEPDRRKTAARRGVGSICGKRILYVDDDEFLRRFAIRILDRAGGICLAAATHAQAIAIVNREPGLALAILDFQMPDGDVGLLVDHLRAADPGLPLLGNSGQDRRDDFAERGVAVFLEKPWTVDMLEQAMHW